MAGLRDGILGSVDSTATVTNIAATGNVDLGDASGDTISIDGTIDTDVVWGTTKKVNLRDAAIYLNSSVDGQMDIVADGECQIASPIVDINASTGLALDGANLNSAWTVNAANKLLFRDTGLYLNSSVDGQLDIVADTTVALSGAVTADSTLSVTGAATFTAGQQSAAVAVTPTADGLTTGTIADGTSMVALADGGNADFWIILPAPTPGNIVWLMTSADSTGFEIRSSAPSTVLINGGVGGAAVESAIPATATLVRCVCVSATLWICSMFDADGDEAKVEAAAA